MRNADYFVKRTATAAATMFIAITLNFVLFRAVPGSAVTNLSRVPNSTPELRLALEREFGLDRPIWDQYVIYLDKLAHGNLGISFGDRQPVAEKLRKGLANTIPMVLLATLLSIALGTITGVVAAWRRGTAVAQLFTGVALLIFALPTQWLGLMLLLVFAGKLPAAGMADPFLSDPSFLVHLKDLAIHMTLPALTLALTGFGWYVLVVRSSMLATLGEDYILTARAKGLSSWTIVRTEALRNAMLPLITVMALDFGSIVGGTILVESVFSWPGIGRTIFEAVALRDYPMLQGAFLVITLSVITFTFIADLLYFRLDPRVTE